MPRIPVHDVDDAPVASQQALQGLQRRMGTLLNIHAEMAHSPVVLSAYTGMQQAIGEHGTFDTKTREAIALTVAAVDHCEYCLAAHTGSARKAGWTEQDTISIRAGQIDFDDRLAALLSVAAETAGGVGYVEDATWKAALDAGWSTEQLAEAFAHVMANVFTNFFNHYAGTELDVPAAPPLPQLTGQPPAAMNAAPAKDA